MSDKFSRAVATSCLILALAGAAFAQAAEGLAPPTLEQLYRAKPYAGEVAKDIEFSRSGRYLAYRWNPYGEPGTDLYVYDTQAGKAQRLTSPAVMAAFDAPEDQERFATKRQQKIKETADRQAREEAQQAYLRGETVDLNQWDRQDLEQVKKEFAEKLKRDEAQKAADKLDAEQEKQAMAALEARRAGKPAPAASAASAASAVAAAAPASAASSATKQDWEWRDELRKWRKKNAIKPTDTYPGVVQAVWAHQKDELIFQYRGGLFRWQAGSARIEPLQATQRMLKIIAYSADDQGYVFSDDKRVLRAGFKAGGVEVINRELIHPDDADKKYKIDTTVISEDGRWMAVVGSAPLKVGEDGKPGDPPEHQVEIMNYSDRWATAKKVGREVSDDKRTVRPTALYIRHVPTSGEAPTRQPEPVFTNAGGDVWFEMSAPAWTKDGSHYAFATWEREKELLRVYLGKADEAAKPEVVLERRGDVGHEVVNVMDPQFTPDGKSLVLALDEAGFRQPYAIDVETHALRQLVKGDFEAPTVIGFTPDSKTMFVASNKEDFAAMNLYRVDMASGAMTTLGAAGEYYREPTVSHDGRLLAADAGNWTARPELKLLNAGLGTQAGAEKTITQQTHDSKGWAAVDVLHPERFSFQNRHGDTLQAYVFKPPGWKATDQRPGVIYVYGGPLNDRHIVEVDSYQQTGYVFAMYMAAKHGYVMLTVDPRGLSNYGRKFSDANWEEPGKPQADDLEDAKNYAVAHLGMDTNRVGLTGWSFGGFQTQYTLYTKPDLFAAGIAGAGPTEWENYNSWYSGRTIGKVDRSKPALRKFSLLPLARNLKRPLLLVHGMQDPNVLYQDTVNVYRALIESGKDALVDLYLDPDGVHALGGAAKPVNLHRKFEAFWLRTLGDAAPAK
ncbi:MAG TPA: prolyl oligopeptidase family serine peptidase [Burkholderiaceae bacterium]